MTTSDYSENALVEQPTIALFAELGWETANCFYETFGLNGTLGRETSAEVVLVPRLRTALERLNPDLPAEAFTLAIEELTRDRSAMSPAQANREIYRLLKNSVKVAVRSRRERGEETVETVQVIDWNEPSNNDFFLASQFWVSGVQMIDEYNSGSMNIELFFDNLVKFARALNAEEKRAMAEQLSEEELAIFDLLTKPEMILKKSGVREVKKVARKLLTTLKREKLVLDWRKRQQARAAVRLSIEEILDMLPPIYTPELYRRKCDIVYQHVYDSYFGPGRSIYSIAA